MEVSLSQVRRPPSDVEEEMLTNYVDAPSDDMARSGFLEECQGLHERVVRGLGNFKKVPATYKNNLADLKGVKTS
jgi:hypothetical protein